MNSIVIPTDLKLFDPEDAIYFVHTLRDCLFEGLIPPFLRTKLSSTNNAPTCKSTPDSVTLLKRVDSNTANGNQLPEALVESYNIESTEPNLSELMCDPGEESYEKITVKKSDVEGTLFLVKRPDNFTSSIKEVSALKPEWQTEISKVLQLSTISLTTWKTESFLFDLLEFRRIVFALSNLFHKQRVPKPTTCCIFKLLTAILWHVSERSSSFCEEVLKCLPQEERETIAQLFTTLFDSEKAKDANIEMKEVNQSNRRGRGRGWKQRGGIENG